MITLFFLGFFMWVINLLFNPCWIKEVKNLLPGADQEWAQNAPRGHQSQYLFRKIINIWKIFNIKLCTRMHNKNKEYIKKPIQSSFTALWKQCTHDTLLSCVAFSRFATSTSKVATLTFHTNMYIKNGFLKRKGDGY